MGLPGRKTDEWHPKFLRALRRTPVVAWACKSAGVRKNTAYAHRKDNPEFAAEWEEALAEGIGRLEREAFRRAVEGVRKAEYYKGEIVGYEREYSDTLMVLLLKSHAPETYRETVRQELTGADGGALKIEVQPIDYRDAIAPLAPGPMGDSDASSEG
jgi:hypothetical protein